MKKYGNIPFNRRVVAFVCLLVVAVSVLMPAQIVRADETVRKNVSFKVNRVGKDGKETLETFSYSFDVTSDMPVYSYTTQCLSGNGYDISLGFVSSGHVSVKLVSKSEPIPIGFTSSFSFNNDTYTFLSYYVSKPSNLNGGFSDLYAIGEIDDVKHLFLDYARTGVKGEGLQVGYGTDEFSTAVTNQSIGYLQDVKLNLSYITPIKGDSIFQTTNYQIYTDMFYNLKWNGKKTSTNYDLSSSYVQLFAKAEYRKSEFDDVTASDFIALGDYVKASKGKLKFSFMELFEKSNNCKSAYLSAFPLSSADYKNGKLIACSVTSNIKYKFYIRVYKGTDKGPWLCVSEKGSHHSNEFVNSGDKVPFNVSSGDLKSDGTYKPDGNINENGNGITGTGKDKDDADADTNANDKIQTKHDSSDNSVWDNLENLVSGIASVPIIIKDIFSFLPSWCLDVAATGFALMITVCIIRFIRGK